MSNDVAAALSAAQRVGARSFNSFSNSSHGKLTKSFTDEDARKTFRSVEHSLLHSSSMTYCRLLTVTVGFCLGNAVVWWQRHGILLVLLSCSAAEVFFGGMSIGVVRSSLGIGIFDGLIRDAAEDREAVPTCGVDEANSARDTLVTAVVLSDVSRFGNGERRADDGESGTRLDISITRLEEAKKVVADEILSPIARLLVVTSSSIFLKAFADQ